MTARLLLGLLALLVLAGCAGAHCPPGARAIDHPDWGHTCFWPEPPHAPEAAT
jgi:hypothetical protein